jgi:hypothetical protein
MCGRYVRKGEPGKVADFLGVPLLLRTLTAIPKYPSNHRP